MTSLIDFTAFYCAAAAAGAGADPYRIEPLRTCEASAVAIPAPLPSYVFAFLRPLTHVPLGTASAAWLLLSLAAVVVTCVLVAKLTDLRPLWIVPAFGLTEGIRGLPEGQLIAFVTAAVCMAAYALRRGRPELAAICIAAAMIEPHLGFPAAVAMFLWIPQTRRTLLACAALLTCLSIVAVGIPANIEYFTAVLPAHAHSELAFMGQYSLSALLYRFGMPAEAALRIGECQYALMLVLGIRIAQRCAAAFEDPAFIPLVPLVFAVIGGAFIHDTQMAVALPATLLLLARMPSRRPLYAALLLLAVPWGAILNSFALVQALGVYSEHGCTAVVNGNLIAEAAWEAKINCVSVLTLRATLELIAIKLPTWTALIIVAYEAFAAAAPALRRDERLYPGGAGLASPF